MAMKGTGNLTNLARVFADEKAAHDMLARLRWPNGAACPRCGGCDPYKLTPKPSGGRPARQGLYKCRACRKQFSTTTNTIFEASHIPVSKWLMALHLMASSKKGMSAHQLHRMLGMTYRAAWFMAHRLRAAMADESLFSGKPMMGTVETDETYVGAKRLRGSKRGRPGPASHKAPVVALVERGGRVRMFPMGRVTGDNLKAALKANVHPSARLVTDEWRVYIKPGQEFALHETVNHSREEYVRGDIHTNTVEGVFSLLKRGLVGSFHHVSKGHLHRYCSEFEFRYNNRIALGVDDSQRAANIVLGAEGKRLTFKQPSSASAA